MSVSEALDDIRARLDALEDARRENDAFLAWLQDDDSVSDPLAHEPDTDNGESEAD